MTLKIKLSEEQLQKIRQNPEEQYWDSIYSGIFVLSDEFIIEFEDYINFYKLGIYVDISENIMQRYSKHFNWYWLSDKQKMSSKFIRENLDNINFYNIAINKKISEQTIFEIKDLFSKSDAMRLSLYRKLSKEFIIENIDFLDLNSLLMNDYIDKDIKDYIRMFL